MLDATSTGKPCPRCSSSAGPGHSFANLGGETCSGEPWHKHEPSHESTHDRARLNPDIFATFEYVGQMPSETAEHGRPCILLLANCPTCHSTISRVVDVGSAEALAYRGKVAA